MINNATKFNLKMCKSYSECEEKKNKWRDNLDILWKYTNHRQIMLIWKWLWKGKRKIYKQVR